MRRTYHFVEPSSFVTCALESGTRLDIPVVFGVLKHPSVEQLPDLLTDPVVVRKYTEEALRKAPWIALRAFPRWWLLDCLATANLREGRRKAVEYMLGV